MSLRRLLSIVTSPLITIQHRVRLIRDLSGVGGVVLVFGFGLEHLPITFLRQAGSMLLNMGYTLLTVSTIFFLQVSWLELRSGRSRPAMRSLSRFADFFGLRTRKQIKAMAGDFQVEITRLRRAGRPWAARWNIGLAWGYAMYFVGRGPVDKLLKVLRKALWGSLT